MSKKRSLSQLWSNTFVIVMVAIGILLADDVSYAATPTDLSIELMACPSSPVPEGARVMLTGKVTSAAATGQMQFTDTLIETTDGSKPTPTDLGTVSLPPYGTASLPTEPLKKGTHTLTATFTPTDTTSFKTPTPATIQLVVAGGNGLVQTAVSQKHYNPQTDEHSSRFSCRVSTEDPPLAYDLMGFSTPHFKKIQQIEILGPFRKSTTSGGSWHECLSSAKLQWSVRAQMELHKR